MGIRMILSGIATIMLFVILTICVRELSYTAKYSKEVSQLVQATELIEDTSIIGFSSEVYPKVSGSSVKVSPDKTITFDFLYIKEVKLSGIQFWGNDVPLLNTASNIRVFEIEGKISGRKVLVYGGF